MQSLLPFATTTALLASLIRQSHYFIHFVLHWDYLVVLRQALVAGHAEVEPASAVSVGSPAHQLRRHLAKIAVSVLAHIVAPPKSVAHRAQGLGARQWPAAYAIGEDLTALAAFWANRTAQALLLTLTANLISFYK
jgi:hypothetical protein